MDHHNRLNLLERAEPGMILFDDDFQVTHVNWALLRLIAETPQNAVFEQSLLEMHRSPTAKKLRELVAAMRDPSRQVSISVRRMSGPRELFVLLKFVPLLGPKLSNALHCCLLYDITADISAPQHGLLKVPVTTGGEILLISPDQITYIKAENIYSHVVTADGEFFCDLSLGVLEAGLQGQSFFRIHRSYLVNVGRVQKVIRNGSAVNVQMAGSDRRLPVSRARAREFLNCVGLK